MSYNTNIVFGRKTCGAKKAKWKREMSPKVEKWGFVLAVVLTILIGFGNALAGGLGVMQLIPPELDAVLGYDLVAYDESVRNLAQGLLMIVLAVLVLWRRSQVALLAAGAIVVVSYTLFLMQKPDRLTIIVQGVFVAVYALSIVGGLLCLRREEREKASNGPQASQNAG